MATPAEVLRFRLGVTGQAVRKNCLRRKEEMSRSKKVPLTKAAPVTKSHGYADALRIGSLTELEKQWLYWREPARRDAERARPWNTYKG